MELYHHKNPEFEKDPHKCVVCGNPSLLTIEWYGVNQHGKNPELVDETYSCGSFEHLCHASHHWEYGGVPDSILLKLDHSEQSDLLRIVAEILAPKSKPNAGHVFQGMEAMRKIKLGLCADQRLKQFVSC